MRIVFFGSDDFAAVHLEHVLKSKHDVLCCVTGPDKPQGRGMKVSVGPIKQMAQDQKIPCLQPLTLKGRETVDALKTYGADVFVVVAYGRLLTQEILDIPKILCLNVHGSLLPKYRGAAPINWAILNGDKETGITVQKMALALDSGEIIAQEMMDIDDNEDAAQLRRRMALAGAGLLVKVLDKGQFSLTPQNEGLVTWAPKLTREMGKIDWKAQASSIVNRVRGLKPWPGAYTFYNGKMIKILRARISAQKQVKSSPGEIIGIGKDGIHVACSDQAVMVQEVQPEAGKAMPAYSFLIGNKIEMGTTFL